MKKIFLLLCLIPSLCFASPFSPGSKPHNGQEVYENKRNNFIPTQYFNGGIIMPFSTSLPNMVIGATSNAQGVPLYIVSNGSTAIAIYVLGSMTNSIATVGGESVVQKFLNASSSSLNSSAEAISFDSFNASFGQKTFAKITGTATDATAGAEFGDLYFSTIKSTTLAEKLRITGAGHIRMTGTAPTIANNDCGTTSQGTVGAGSNDVRGSITVGTLAVTSCAMTFNTAYATAPTCVTQDDTNILGTATATTTTKMTVTSTTSMSGDSVKYICFE